MDVYSKLSSTWKSNHWDSTSELSYIEDNLTTPENQQVFLNASLAFLQKKLEEKLNEKVNNDDFRRNNEKSYSNLLIFEYKNGEISEKCFVRIKNEEKYEKILKKECTISPEAKLSLEQIIPKPKKPKTENRSLISLLKRSALKINVPREPAAKKSASFLTIFKHITPNASRSNLSCASAISLQTNAYFKNLKLPSTPSDISVLSGFIKPQRTESCCSYRSGKSNRSSYSKRSTRTRQNILSHDEIEILHMIPQSPRICQKHHHCDKQNSLKEYSVPMDCGDSVCSSSSNNGHNAVKKCPSKLSICIEEDEEGDEEENEGGISSYDSSNLTDEIKSNFSIEGLDVIMRRLIQYFEYNAENVS